MAVGLIAALLFAVLAANASGLPLLTKFGVPGTAGGAFEVPLGIGVNQLNGDVYVADAANNRVQKFDALGKFNLAFGGAVDQQTAANICLASSGDTCQTGAYGGNAGFFSIPIGLAVDSTNGDVYVVDIGNNRVEKYGPGGEFILAFGGNVDKTTNANVCTATSKDVCGEGSFGSANGQFIGWTLGNFIATGQNSTVLVADESRIQEFSPEGVYQSQIALPAAGQIAALAVDPNGNLYVKGAAFSGVREYNAAGAFIRTLDETGLPEAVAPDAAGDVFISDSGGGLHVLEYSSGGTGLGEFGASAGIASSLGIAVESAFEDAYVTDRERDEVYIFGAPPHIPPTITSESVGELGTTTAVVDARINPDMSATNYYVQYGIDTSYASGTAPSLPGNNLGGAAANENKSVATSLTGLAPDTTYHFRFVATNASGTVHGADKTFHTYPLVKSGLPDQRAYEQVSPIEKDGNEAGASARGGSTRAFYVVARGDGERLLFGATGPFSETFSGASENYVAHRTPAGWVTAAALPPGYGANAANIFAQHPQFLYPSTDLTHMLFTAGGSFVKALPPVEGIRNTSEAVYLASEDIASEPLWLSAPLGIGPAEVLPEPGHITTPNAMALVGGSPDLRTAYFSYYGTLLPEDASRKPNFDPSGNGPWGFYEWKEGALRPVGELPNGSYDPFGAVPAVTLDHAVMAHFVPDDFNNEVAANGTRAFFLSPDPSSAHPSGDPPELYVREDGRKTVLISRNALGPPVAGQPAPAEGPEAVVPWSAPDSCGTSCALYVFASADGSRAFFRSQDKLAKGPEGQEITGTGPWMYEFNLDTNSLTYLPEVQAPILASSADGSRFLFETSGPAHALDLWAAGKVTTVAEWTTPEAPWIAPVRATPGGEVFVFETSAVVDPGRFNNYPSHRQIYRYEASTHNLICVSCPPAGIIPAGDAHLSNDDAQPEADIAGEGKERLTGSQGLTSDGGRIFFDTTEALVSNDVNGRRDVYEWENGGVNLVSTGTSTQPSIFLDNSESGADVFFATIDGLSPGDTDGSYDIYDARVGGGFERPMTPSACVDGCQAQTLPFEPPSVVSLATGASGNLAAPVVHKVLRTSPHRAKHKRRSKHKKGHAHRSQTGVHRPVARTRSAIAGGRRP